MKEKGIGVSQTHNRNDKTTCFSDSIDESYSLIGLDKFFSTMSCIPVGWWLTEEDVEYITSSVLQYINLYGIPES